MARRDINTLFTKKGWTGAELGRLEIATVMKAYQRALNGEADPQPEISREDFNRMVKTLEDPAQGKIYNGYLSVHDWISRASIMAVSQEQQAQLRFNELATPIETANVAEQLYQYVAELPLIMTEKQYKELVAKRTKEIINDGVNGEPVYYNLFGVIQDAISYYIKLLHENPRKKNPLKPLREKLEKELVTDPRILSRYNEVTDNGYYTLPDGRRSDEMTDEEWQKALAPEVREALDSDSNSQRMDALDRKLQVARDIYNGMTEEEAREAQTQRDTESGLFQKTEWHLYPDPPKDLTKWEILESDSLYEYYPTLAGEDPTEGQTEEEAFLEQAKAFKKEFPSVVGAILKDMDTTLKGYVFDTNGDPITKKVSSLTVEEWYSHFITWENLYKLDAYGFRALYFGDSDIFDKEKRPIFNGIAILRPSDLLNKSKRIDANGYYTPPEIETAIDGLSLLSYTPENENYAVLTDGLELARKVLIDSVYWLTGYNTAVELVADYYEVEELKIALVNTDSLLNRIQAFNDFVAMLYSRIKAIDYEDEEVKAKKLEVLKDVFYPIDTSIFAIPEEKKKKARSWLRDFKAFKDEDKDLCPYLCYKGVKA